MIRRGEIYFARLDPTEGREQLDYRPVLVVSSDAINRQPLVVAVVAGTDAANVARDYPTNVRVTARETGLPREPSSSASSSAVSTRRAYAFLPSRPDQQGACHRRAWQRWTKP